MNFKDKTILITGASAGIGYELARQLATKARTLVLVARRRQELEELKQELISANQHLTIELFAIDLSIPENLPALKSDLEEKNISVDTLINNAGVGDEALFHKAELPRLQKIVDLNVSSVLNLTHLFMEDFVAEPKGKSIVFIGSGAGIAWMPGSAVYSASKHFITALAMNLRSELKPLGIEVALVTPGPVDSEFDTHAGIDKGMKGGPSQDTRITAATCAADTIRLLEKDKALVIPGKKIRRLLNLYLWFPWWLRKKLVEKDGKELITNQSL